MTLFWIVLYSGVVCCFPACGDRSGFNRDSYTATAGWSRVVGKPVVMMNWQDQNKIAAVHARLWKEFLNPKQHTLYDMSIESWYRYLPTPEEVQASITNQCGWDLGIEDCALNGGYYITTMIKRYLTSGLPEDLDQARKIFQGLYLLGTVSDTRGFVARGVHPADNRSYYVNSSIDQHTAFVYGFWMYYHSPAATDEEKAIIGTVISHIAARIEKDGFDILTSTGEKAWVCDIGTIQPGRSLRLLEIFLAAYDMTGDDHWLKVYREKKSEEDYARVRDLLFEEDRPMSMYVFQQEQVALRCLYGIETDPETKVIYETALNGNARRVKETALTYQLYEPEKIHKEIPPSFSSDWRIAYEPFQHLGRLDRVTFKKWQISQRQRLAPVWGGREHETIRQPLEAMHVILLSEDTPLKKEIAPHFQQALRAYQMEKFRFVYGVYLLEEIYYLGLIQGLWEEA